MAKYCVLGGGRQGTAIAYDLCKHGNSESIMIVDIDAVQAEKSAHRVNALCDSTMVDSKYVDVKDEFAMMELLNNIDVLISAVPYHLNTMITEYAIRSTTSMVDLGGHTEIVRAQLKRHNEAENRGITIVPDCGMGPGMNITLALLAMEQLDTPEHVRIWDGGLPMNPQPPWNYALFFNIDGLTNEYDGNAFYLRNGVVTEVPCFEDIEIVEFGEPLGNLEAAVTSGGLSTMPWTYAGKIQTLENKTLRYSGHWSQMVAYRQLGLFNMESFSFQGSEIIPREFYHALLEPKLNIVDVSDVCIMRTQAEGLKNACRATAQVDTVEYFDEKTGFTAMEKWTGWHASMMAIRIINKLVGPGAVSVENAMSGEYFLKEARERGFEISVDVQYIK